MREGIYCKFLDGKRLIQSVIWVTFKRPFALPFSDSDEEIYVPDPFLGSIKLS